MIVFVLKRDLFLQMYRYVKGIKKEYRNHVDMLYLKHSGNFV